MDVQDAISKRHTLKVLADPESPWPTPNESVRERFLELLKLATQAPYHKPADQVHCDGLLNSPVPWRFHALDGENCRRLLHRMTNCGVETGKIKNMLAAADCLFLTTWLPNPSEEPLEFQQYEPTLQNMEHIAAASSAIQNLLLLATAGGWNSYWSSGAILRSELVYGWTGINTREILLGAVFVFPSETRDAPAKPGSLRDRKGSPENWSRWVEVDDEN